MKKILTTIVTIILCINILSVNTFATISENLDGGKPPTPTDNNTTPNSSGDKKPSGGGKTTNYNSGSSNYPYKIYKYTDNYCPYLMDRYNSFCSNTTNGSATDTAYRGTDKIWSINNGKGDQIFYQNTTRTLPLLKWEMNC